MVFSPVIRDALVVSSSSLVGEPLGSFWHLHHHPYVQCAQCVRLSCLVILPISSLRTNWCYLIPRSVLNHNWSRASILHAFTLVIAQHSDPYRKIGRIQVLYNFSFIGIEMCDFQKWLSRFCIAVWVLYHCVVWCREYFVLISGWQSRGTQTGQLPRPVGPELWWLVAHSPWWMGINSKIQ